VDRPAGSVPPTTVLRQRPVIAVAGGPVFSFRYTETTELLTAAGADVATFDPLTDTLPAFNSPDGATVPVTPAMMTELD